MRSIWSTWTSKIFDGGMAHSTQSAPAQAGIRSTAPGAAYRQVSLGEIEEGLWYQLAELLIQRAGEQKLLNALIDWESRHNFTKASAQAIRRDALKLHISRIFDNPRWVSFIPFNRKYRPEALKNIQIVTVVNECCGKPGEVTQEQVTASHDNMVTCPHCGRWSRFSIIEPEQAMQHKEMEMM